jgi:small subunit ribosomal protein S17
MSAVTNKREYLEGVVAGAKAQKTITVRVPMVVKHPKYGKFLRRERTYHVHDENNEAKAGERVRIVQVAPISKTKNWRLVEVLERAQVI